MAPATNSATRQAAIVVQPPQLPHSSAWMIAAAKVAIESTTTSASAGGTDRSLNRRAPSHTNPGTSTNRLLPTATETNPPTPDDQAMYATVVDSPQKNATAQSRPGPESRRNTVSRMNVTLATDATIAAITVTLKRSRVIAASSRRRGRGARA